MEWFFATQRKFSWTSCTVCGGLALFLGAVVAYGAMAIADANKETRVGEQGFVQESIVNWNTSLPSFTGLLFTVQFLNSPSSFSLVPNTTVDYSIRGWPKESYPHLKYFAEVNPFTDFSSLSNETSPGLLNPLNLTTSMKITYSQVGTNTTDSYMNFPRIVLFRRDVVRLNQKMCNMHHNGLWDLSTRTCYQFFVLSEVCLVYNLTEKTLGKGCRGVLEQWDKLYWMTMDVPDNLTREINVTVRAHTDPYLVDAELKSISNSHMEEVIIGALLIVIGCLFFLIPIIYFWQVLRSRRETLLEKRTFEMAQPREGYIPRY